MAESVRMPPEKPWAEGRPSMLVCYKVSKRPSKRITNLVLAGGWIRGDAKDYDLWASVVNDQRWSYAGFLPFFIKTERHHDPSADPAQHGFDGPIRTQTARTTGRDYPLREPTKAAFAAIGINEISDANSGSPQGLAQCTEAWNHGKRQLASQLYPLDSVEVLTDTLVRRVLIEENQGRKVAVAVELADGRTIRASREVILCAGAYRTPQVLLLSGIGAEEELSMQGIKQVINLPDVGRNLHDHLAASQYWKLRDPAPRLAAGDPDFNNPAYALGLPLDWIATQSVPVEGLKSALEVDEGKVVEGACTIGPKISSRAVSSLCWGKPKPCGSFRRQSHNDKRCWTSAYFSRPGGNLVDRPS
jgi:hypothetical protein